MARVVWQRLNPLEEFEDVDKKQFVLLEDLGFLLGQVVSDLYIHKHQAICSHCCDVSLPSQLAFTEPGKQLLTYNRKSAGDDKQSLCSMASEPLQARSSKTAAHALFRLSAHL